MIEEAPEPASRRVIMNRHITKESIDINLQKLNDAVAIIVKHDSTLRVIERLRKENDKSQQPFVWATIDLRSIDSGLPENIKSGWIFVLKQDVPSGCHYHPNSIQHMVMIEGEGKSTVGDLSRRMLEFVNTSIRWMKHGT